MYAKSEELQPVDYHEVIMKNAIYSKIQNSLSKKYQISRVWITMTVALRKTYIDGDDNLQYENKFLEELNQLLEKLVEYSQKKRRIELKIYGREVCDYKNYRQKLG